MQIFKPKTIIYIDVDDTMINTFGSKRIPKPDTLKAIKTLAEMDVELYCWSMGGADYAKEIATQFEVAQYFKAFLPKPHIMIDDSSLNDFGINEIHPNDLKNIDWKNFIS